MKKLLFLILTVCIGVVLSSTSCKKKTEPKVVITVVDTAGKIIQGAKVRITSKTYNAASVIDETGTTDVKGKAYFTFKLEAILEVIATAKTNREGSDFIQLEMGKTAEKTITVK